MTNEECGLANALKIVSRIFGSVSSMGLVYSFLRGKMFFQKNAGIGFCDAYNLMGLSASDNLTPFVSRFRPQVNNPIAIGDNVHIMLNNNNCVTASNKSF